ncbi:MAG: protein kinase, partial [Candidatus Hydrogenedentes bacterium]|nr:protein kinase [Candidatus Hydrogenedentota bacterium]
ARIEHPNVVRVYRVDICDGRLAIEMQFVDGTPLNVLLQSRRFSPSDGSDLLHQVLEALVACHDHGVIHCDLKPGNLLVMPDGHVMLADFGISRALYDTASSNPSSTHAMSFTGPMWGTPQYCPPEAWEGGAVTPQWDLYAAGALVYEAISGEMPFHGPTPAALMKAVLTTTPAPLRDTAPVSDSFSLLIESMLARNPEERPASAKAALTTLSKTPEGGSLSTATIPFPKPGPSVAAPQPSAKDIPAKKNTLGPKKVVSVLAATLVFVVLASIWSVQRAGETQGTAFVDVDPRVGQMLVVGNTAFFTADDGVHGKELWRSDSDGGCTLVFDVVDGAGSSDPRNFFKREGGGFVFTADSTDAGAELWFCDGQGASPESVRLIKEIVPGPLGSDPIAVASGGPTVLFYAKTAGTGSELWQTDTMTAEIVADLFPGVQGSLPLNPRTCADQVGFYFVAVADESHGCALYNYTYADGQVRRLGKVGDHSSHMVSAFKGLFIGTSDAEHGYELWLFEKDRQEPRLVRDILPGVESSHPSQFSRYDNEVCFQARTPEIGLELYRSNGTEAGTTIIADINPGAHDSDPSGFVTVGQHVFFSAKDNAHGRELWAWGFGTSASLVADIRPGPDSSGPYNLVAGDSYLLFTADDGVHGEELWTARWADDKWHTRMVTDIYDGPVGAEPHQLQWTQDNKAFFVAKTPDAGQTLCAIYPGPDLRGVNMSGAEPTRVEVLRLREADTK